MYACVRGISRGGFLKWGRVTWIKKLPLESFRGAGRLYKFKGQCP